MTEIYSYCIINLTSQNRNKNNINSSSCDKLKVQFNLDTKTYFSKEK